jgi:hypothetical protein
MPRKKKCKGRIEAEFDDYGILDRATIVSETYDFRIYITRYFNTLNFNVKWGEYEVDFTKPYDEYFPAFVKKDEFYQEFTSPLRALQIVMTILSEFAYEVDRKVREIEEEKRE